MPTAIEPYTYARIRVRFFDVDMPIVTVGSGKGKVQYFPIRPLCQVIGVTVQGQIDKLRMDSQYAERDGIRELPCPTVKGLRDMLCVKRSLAVKWLSQINPNNCKITARGPLERFREELFAAADRLWFGDARDLSRDGAGRPILPVYGVIHLGRVRAAGCI